MPAELPGLLSTARAKTGLSQTQVADEIPVSRTLYAKFERGELVPSEGAILELARVLQTDVRDLLAAVPVAHRLSRLASKAAKRPHLATLILACEELDEAQCQWILGEHFGGAR